MTSNNATVRKPAGKPPERNMLLKLSFVRGFCWMEIPRLDLYLPATFRQSQQFSRGKTLAF